MLEQHDAEGFGPCSQHGECEAVCPKGISLSNIARMNGDYLFSQVVHSPRVGASTEGG
jgi:succinate dehydrogenase / fumarate reductase iron-sulfur subunit